MPAIIRITSTSSSSTKKKYLRLLLTFFISSINISCHQFRYSYSNSMKFNNGSYLFDKSMIKYRENKP